MQTNGIAALDTYSEAYGQPAVSISEAATGPSWQEARGGSGRGRFRGLAEFIFPVFLPSLLPVAFAPDSTSRKPLQTVLFKAKNSHCKGCFVEQDEPLAQPKTRDTRGNTKSMKIWKKAIWNYFWADGASPWRCSRGTELITWLADEVMEISNLQKRIAEHHEALAALSRCVDQVFVGVEALTLEAHDALAEYQEKKCQAGKALSTASQKSLLAQRAFGEVDDLLLDVTAVENTHIALSHSVNDLLARDNSPQAQRILREFMKIRRTFRVTSRQIERCRKEARLTRTYENNNPGEQTNQ